MCHSINVIRYARKLVCPWTFSKFKWWVRWVKKPFSQNFVPTLPCSPKFSSFTRKYASSGYNGESLRSKVLYSFGMECWYLDTSKKESKKTRGKSTTVQPFIPMDEIWISPCLSFALEKESSACDSCAFQWCPYIYICIYIYDYIATYSYRGDSLT